MNERKSSRKDFIKDLFAEVFIIVDEALGNDNLALNAVKQLSDDELFGIKVAFYPDINISRSGNTISFISRKDKKRQSTLELSDLELTAFDQLRENKRFGDVVLACVQNHSATESAVLPLIRELLFRLFDLHLCHPDNSPDESL